MMMLTKIKYTWLTEAFKLTFPYRAVSQIVLKDDATVTARIKTWTFSF